MPWSFEVEQAKKDFGFHRQAERVINISDIQDKPKPSLEKGLWLPLQTFLQFFQSEDPLFKNLLAHVISTGSIGAFISDHLDDFSEMFPQPAEAPSSSENQLNLLDSDSVDLHLFSILQTS